MRKVLEITPLDKGKICLVFEPGETLSLYRGELKRLRLSVGEELEEEVYESLVQIVCKRAKKRAMHLLEKKDQTKVQLRDKLKDGGYPLLAIDQAIEYLEEYGYVDDFRYACIYVRYHQKKKSERILFMDLIRRGISKEEITQALLQEFTTSEEVQIVEYLHKKKYSNTGDQKEFRRMYQFLMRKGYSSSLSLKKMKEVSSDF